MPSTAWSVHFAPLCCRISAADIADPFSPATSTVVPDGSTPRSPVHGPANAATSVDYQDLSPADAKPATKSTVEINSYTDFAKSVGYMGYVFCGEMPCFFAKEIATRSARAALRSILPRSSESC